MEHEHLLKEWKQLQNELSSKVITEDQKPWQETRSMCYVAGADISFGKKNTDVACVALVVCRASDLETVYSDVHLVTLDTPYIPGYLGFREAPAVIASVEKLKRQSPDLFPDVILVDGNGILHPRKFGLACHLGVTLQVPTIGVAKNLYQMESLLRNEEHKSNIGKLAVPGDSFPLQINGEILGLALKTTEEASKPVFISVGHAIGLETAKWVIAQCCKFRIPEPVRIADILSREYIRKNNY